MPPKSSNAESKLQFNQIQHLHLAGTVRIPRHVPELGRIWYWPKGVVLRKKEHTSAIIRIEHQHGHSATVTRTCLLQDVSAIFVPDDSDDVNLSNGEYLLGPEINETNWAKLDKDKDGAVRGIVHVPESARVLMEVSMGMTAGQSLEYTPPLGAVFCE